MAYQTTITLTDKDYKILEELKEQLGLSYSQAVATALQVAKTIRDSQSEGNEILLKNTKTDEEKGLRFVGL